MIRQPDRTLVLLLCLSAFAWMPLAAPGYFLNAHDAQHSLFFLEAFDEAIRDGSWWPAWGPHFAFGYGYPLWIFYAPLTYFAGEMFHLLGASITTSMKLVDLFSTLAATLSMYGWARSHFGKQASAFAAVVYTFAPYHLLDLYVRSAVAEYATFVFFPLLFWRWETLLHSPSRRNAILAALVTAGLVLTHHGAAFIFATLLAAYLLFLLARLHLSLPGLTIRRIGYSVCAGVLALGLSAIFWLPVLLEQRYIVVDQWTSVAYNYQKHFVYLNQFFSPFWGYGYSGEGLADGMSFQLGLIPIVGGAIALIPAASGIRSGAGRRATVVFFLVAATVVALLMSPISGPFWQAVPVAALVQFPWRLLALSTIALAWLAGAALEALLSDRLVPAAGLDSAAALLMMITVLAGFNYTLPQYTERSAQAESARAAVDFELVSYRDRTGYMTWASEQPQTSPLVEQYKAGTPLTRAVVLRGNAQLMRLHDGGESHSVHVNAISDSTIQFRVYYFPGWSARVDGKPAPLWPAGPQALITLDVPPGEHDVEIRLMDTNVRALAKLISLISLLVIAAWLAIGRLSSSRISGSKTGKTSHFHVFALAIFVWVLSACDGGTPAPMTPTPLMALAATPVATATPQPTESRTSTPADTATATVTSTPRPAAVQHVVQPNQTISEIALLYGTTVDAILKANNISDPRFVRAGQTLIIPLPTITPTATVTPTPNATQAALPPSPTPNIYVVQGGDVLSAIAAKYNIPVDDIQAANGLKDTVIRVGQQLIIPPPTPTPTLTATPLPTSTPTPGLSFSAPTLLFPPDGAEFSAGDAIVMNWTAVGVLAADQYYVLRLRSTDGKRVESLWLRTPSFRLPADWLGGQIEWDIIVLQLTKTNPDGTREGKIQSPFSATRRFAWR